MRRPPRNLAPIQAAQPMDGGMDFQDPNALNENHGSFQEDMDGLNNDEQPSMHASGVPNAAMAEDPNTISQPQMDGSIAGQDIDGQEIPTTNISQPDEMPPAAGETNEAAADAAPADQT